MAQFQPAFQYAMVSEDPRLLCNIVPDPCPQGCTGPCFAISGINSGAWPKQFAEIQAKSQSERVAAVCEFYFENFWTPMQLGGLENQDVANRVMDEEINTGKREAVLLLQRAINALRPNAVCMDGLMGQDTLTAANGLDPEALLAAYRQERLSYYRAVIAAHPNDGQYWDAWKARALA